jgi:hypothetical protein
MSTRGQMMHDWRQQVHALLPSVRATRVRGLADFVVGMLWAHTVSLPEIARAQPGSASVPSRERRLRRWLANPANDVATLWDPLVRRLLAAEAGQEVLLVLDPTPQADHATVLVVGLVRHKRVLPLIWRSLPQQAPWPASQRDLLEDLFGQLAQWLPADASVTLLADRGLTSADLLDLCAQVGWACVLRLSADAQHGATVRLADGTTCPVWDLVRGAGQHWTGTVDIFQRQGWRTVELTIHWGRGQAQPWLLLSTRAAGRGRVREYRRRCQAESTYQDEKGRGWRLERSKVRDLARLDRLLLVLALVLWWVHGLGLRVIRSGLRRRYDRRDRRDLSVLRLGWVWMQDLVEHRRLPPFLFRYRHGTWRVRWAS